MSDDHDLRIERIARELQKPVPVSARLDERVMRAIRRLPKHSPVGRWSRLTPRRVAATPLSWGLLAAGLVLLAALTGWFAVDGSRQLTPAGNRMAANVPQHVQFVLVAPDAKKVSVVGDFNGWDVSHANYQAEHRGGGVWSVTASVPIGHHRYSFVVDDSVWMADPLAPRAVDRDFGMPNSAIVVQSQE